MFTGISVEICTSAWGMVAPSIKHCAQREITHQYRGGLVVANPSADEFELLFSAGVRSEILDHDDIEHAISMALISYRTGLPSSVVQTQYPHLYIEEDIKLGGSTVDEGGLVVAFSGVQAVYNEMIAEWVASAIRALCRNEMVRPMGVIDSVLPFLRRWSQDQ